VLKAMALGADACLIGRAFVFGLGAAGEAGVTKALEIIRDELDDAMALTGVKDISKVPGSVLNRTQSESSKRQVHAFASRARATL
jgi:L-lactate dehydrogenase (cytochrome)